MRVASWATRPSGALSLGTWGPRSHRNGALPAYRVSARAGSHVLETQLEHRKDKLGGRPGVLYMSAGAGQNICESILMRLPVLQGRGSCIP
ncbi:unnamed protein product [Rangifer tarandus platyrhynchus]|uniref:Uncharacterized protein n=2 Tax=Rangifer tarandus platyrhynchus TaxID=3082113 RepID=A0ABN8ZVP1_RANTA|nr:unnamed protein product [Rangifer tarandus platyrhynchus]CAI9710552.1 unnamed protein product [Rangifer tarandus platyrhynchus]